MRFALWQHDGFEVDDGHSAMYSVLEVEDHRVGVAQSALVAVPGGAAKMEPVAVRALFWVHLERPAL